MKKKHRDITVDGVKYAWTVKTHDYGSVVSIWLGGKIIHTYDIFGSEPILPYDVSEMIKTFNHKK